MKQGVPVETDFPQNAIVPPKVSEARSRLKHEETVRVVAQVLQNPLVHTTVVGLVHVCCDVEHAANHGNPGV